MITLLGNREGVPKLYAFDPEESGQLDWELKSVDNILMLANKDTVVLTPELLSFMIEHGVPLFDSKKEAKVHAKKLPESQWRYFGIYIPCMEPSYSQSWSRVLPDNKRWVKLKTLS